MYTKNCAKYNKAVAKKTLVGYNLIITKRRAFCMQGHAAKSFKKGLV